MSNITLSIEDDILKKVRKLAVEKNTSLTSLVRNTLRQLAAREDLKTEEIISQLKESFDSGNMEIGDKKWTREDLHAR